MEMGGGWKFIKIARAGDRFYLICVSHEEINFVPREREKTRERERERERERRGGLFVCVTKIFFLLLAAPREDSFTLMRQMFRQALFIFVPGAHVCSKFKVFHVPLFPKRDYTCF